MTARTTLAALVLWLALPAAGDGQEANVAVFNFQMKSDSPEWVWLEKGLADLITTDFAQSRRITVVERDRMQAAAQTIRWAASLEAMQTGSGQKIQQALKVRYVASGVFAVRNGQVEITGQIVDLDSSREVFRKVISGKTQDVLTLQKQLSAELMGFLTGQKPETVLASLPVWTRSVPAAKAIYEGMDLYDAGQYAKAWLKFRLAMRAEPANLEARYWTGKMYCMTGRYDHAQPDLAAFLQPDLSHPVAVDALREYVRSVECGGASEEVMLNLCREVWRRLGRFRAREDWISARVAEREMQDEVAQRLSLMGRHQEAYRFDGFPAIVSERINSSFAAMNIARHHALTGQTPPVKEMTYQGQSFNWKGTSGKALTVENSDMQMDLDYAGATYRFAEGSPVEAATTIRQRILGKGRRNIDKQAAFDKDDVETVFHLVAPDGHVFRRLKVTPVATGSDDGMVEVSLTGFEGGEAFDSRTAGLAEATRSGLAWDRLPSTGLLRVTCRIRVKDQANGMPIQVDSVKVQVVQERLTAHGAVHVDCPDTPNFRARVDGLYGRDYPGLVGPLTPGPHTLQLVSIEKDSPYAPSAVTSFQVADGQVTRVSARLAFEPGGPWSGWSGAVVDARQPRYRNVSSAPAILTDADGIHLAWNDRRDLWTCSSRDGRTFSPPRRVGGGVTDRSYSPPRCFRDASGRYLLTFLADRNGVPSLLASWSRDFTHWSPAVPVPREGTDVTCWCFDVCRTRSGRFVMAAISDYHADVITVYDSSDGLSYARLGQVPIPGGQSRRMHRILLIERDDGTLEIISTDAHFASPRNHVIRRSVSRDGRDWTWPVNVLRSEPNPIVATSALHLGGLTTITVRFDDQPEGILFMTQNSDQFALLAEQPDGRYLRAPMPHGLIKRDVALAHDARWGFLMAWSLPTGGPWGTNNPAGPYLLMGPNLVLPPGGERISLLPRPGSGPARPATFAPEARPVGELELVRVDPVRPIALPLATFEAGEKDFPAPPASDTASWPSTLVTARNSVGGSLRLRIESTDSKSPHPDVVRVDIAGKGDFAGALNLPRTKEFMHMGETRYLFHADEGVVVVDGRKIPVNAIGGLIVNQGKMVMNIGFLWLAQGRVRMGAAEHAVQVADTNGNFRLGDRMKTSPGEGGVLKMRDGDWISIDMGDGSFGDCELVPAGHPIAVDGMLYDISILPDQTRILATPFKGPTGSIRVAQSDWMMKLESADGMVIIRGNNKPAPVPPGRYTVSALRQYLPKPVGGRRETVLIDPHLPQGPLRTIDIAAGQTVDLAMGTPLTAGLEVSRSGDNVRFHLRRQDIGGNRVSSVVLLSDGSNRQTDEATIDILDAAGRSVAKFPAPIYETPATWKPPAGLKGKFTAVLRYRDASLGEVKIEKAPTFELP